MLSSARLMDAGDCWSVGARDARAQSNLCARGRHVRVQLLCWMYIRTRTGRFGSFFFLRRTLSRFSSWRLNTAAKTEPHWATANVEFSATRFRWRRILYGLLIFFSICIYSHEQTMPSWTGSHAALIVFRKTGMDRHGNRSRLQRTAGPRCAADAVSSRRVRRKTVVFLVIVVRRGVKFFFFVLRVFRD